MPEHRPAPDAPGRAALATIQRIKAAIASHPDPETLNEIRSSFRREIPLHLRSYAAALLILEASGGSRAGRRPEGRGPEGNRPEGRKGNEGRRSDNRSRGETPRQPDLRKNDGRKEKAAPRAPDMPSEETRPRFRGEASTIFFGMGKRQRLYPRVLLRILTEEGSLSFEEIGDIRSFDNYSFADVDPLCAESLIAGLDGLVFRGRGLPVSKARKRGAPEESESSGQGPAGEDSLSAAGSGLDDGPSSGFGDDAGYDDMDDSPDNGPVDTDEGYPDDEEDLDDDEEAGDPGDEDEDEGSGR